MMHGQKNIKTVETSSLLTAVRSHPAYCAAVYREWRYQML